MQSNQKHDQQFYSGILTNTWQAISFDTKTTIKTETDLTLIDFSAQL